MALVDAAPAGVDAGGVDVEIEAEGVEVEGGDSGLVIVGLLTVQTLLYILAAFV